jgi:GH25 family lysozyme M1 (1,4-beta-N-acetylmuramidase)
MRFNSLIVIFACITVAYATIGVDVATPVSQSAFQCMVNKNYSFAIIRAFRSVGSPDSNAVKNIANARSAGMRHVDIYMFPCPSCGKPAKQITDMISNLRNTTFGTLWLDIEGTQYWKDQSYNQNFFTGLVKQAQAMGLKLGVYTSRSQWTPIMGNWNGGSAFPLWYAHYDNKHTFSDFVAFGGWTQPSLKQYAGDAPLCGIDTDMSWHP